jgi:hypothetical protein
MLPGVYLHVQQKLPTAGYKCRGGIGCRGYALRFDVATQCSSAWPAKLVAVLGAAQLSAFRRRIAFIDCKVWCVVFYAHGAHVRICFSICLISAPRPCTSSCDMMPALASRSATTPSRPRTRASISARWAVTTGSSVVLACCVSASDVFIAAACCSRNGIRCARWISAGASVCGLLVVCQHVPDEYMGPYQCRYQGREGRLTA